MLINQQVYDVKAVQYIIRSAVEKDAKELSEVRLQIDGETENMDREGGEGLMNEDGFKQLIQNDSKHSKNLFLVAEVNERIAGFARCEGTDLKKIDTQSRIWSLCAERILGICNW